MLQSCQERTSGLSQLLMTKHPNIWAYGGHSYSVRHSVKVPYDLLVQLAHEGYEDSMLSETFLVCVWCLLSYFTLYYLRVCLGPQISAFYKDTSYLIGCFVNLKHSRIIWKGVSMERWSRLDWPVCLKLSLLVGGSIHCKWHHSLCCGPWIAWVEKLSWA